MFNDILLFVRVVECASFSLAAKELGLAQSTVSRRIEQLEEVLGRQLLQRDSRRLHLTPAGQLLFNNFRNFPAEFVERLRQPSVPEISPAQYRLHVILPVAFHNFRLSHMLVAKQHELPGLSLSLEHFVHQIDLLEREYDLAIVPQFNLVAGVSSRLIKKSKIIIVCSEEYAQQRPIPRDLEELKEHLTVSRLLLTQQMATQRIMLYSEDNGEETAYLQDNKLCMNNFAEVKEVVKAGLALAGVPEENISQELASGQLLRILPDYHVGYLHYYLVSRLAANDRRGQFFDRQLMRALADEPIRND